MSFTRWKEGLLLLGLAAILPPAVWWVLGGRWIARFGSLFVIVSLSGMPGRRRHHVDAMKPWVRDMDDTVGANLLTIYQGELAGTHIAYTGSGTWATPVRS